MDAFGITFALVVVVEALIEYFGAPIPSRYKPYAAGVVGIGICLAYGADMLAVLGLHAGVPYVGAVLTGMLISRGSNVFNDLISRLNVIRTPAASVAAVEDASAPVVPSTTLLDALHGAQRRQPPRR